LPHVIQIDESRIQDHLGQVVRGTVEETLNAMLEAEAEQLCQAARYERLDDRRGYLRNLRDSTFFLNPTRIRALLISVILTLTLSCRCIQSHSSLSLALGFRAM
jgi:hypothetical protein